MGELKDENRPVLNSWSAAQVGVIGSMLIDERCLGEVFQATTADMFSEPVYRHIYEAARGLWMEHRPVDPVTVLNACGGEGIGYTETIAEVMCVTPTAANVLEYAEICRQCYEISRYRRAVMSCWTLRRCKTAVKSGRTWAASSWQPARAAASRSSRRSTATWTA